MIKCYIAINILFNMLTNNNTCIEYNLFEYIKSIMYSELLTSINSNIRTKYVCAIIAMMLGNLDSSLY